MFWGKKNIFRFSVTTSTELFVDWFPDIYRYRYLYLSLSLYLSISISIFFNKDSYNNYFLKLSGAGRGSPGTSTGIRETKNRKQTNHVQ